MSLQTRLEALATRIATEIKSVRTLANGKAAAVHEHTLTDLPSAWPKKGVRVATTANITLSGTQTIDGVAVVAGDRVLVKNQTTSAQNGIYVVAAGVWTRATDADTAADIAGGVVTIDLGTTQKGQLWTTYFTPSDTLGTTIMPWQRITDLGMFAAIATSGSASDLTTGTVPYARLPVGTTASTVAAGNDSRLSDARTPTAHTHTKSDITGLPNPPNVQLFDASGTWTKFPGAVLVRIIAIGGGGGGFASTTGNGLPGGVVDVTVAASTLGATEQVIVGAGGVGTFATTLNSVNYGGDTYFGAPISGTTDYLVTAYGGAPRGTNSSLLYGKAALKAARGDGSSSGIVVERGATFYDPAAGVNLYGAGDASTNPAYCPGVGGSAGGGNSQTGRPATYGRTPGVAAGVNGNDGDLSGFPSVRFGSGGGGRAGTSGTGGNGGKYGGGGGNGGSNGGVAGNKAGDGGPGGVLVVTYFG